MILLALFPNFIHADSEQVLCLWLVHGAKVTK